MNGKIDLVSGVLDGNIIDAAQFRYHYYIYQCDNTRRKPLLSLNWANVKVGIVLLLHEKRSWSPLRKPLAQRLSQRLVELAESKPC
jgi:hypothetical protein